MSILRVLSFLLVFSFVLISVSTIIGSVLSILYEPDSSITLKWVLITIGVTLFLIGSQVITHLHHGRVMLPLYLTASYLIAVWFYSFLISLAAGPFMIVLLLSGISFHEVPGADLIRLFIPILLFVILLYGTLNARYLRIRHVGIPLGLNGSRPVRIALISDLHLGLMVGKSRLDAISRTLKKERPDIIVSAGDLTDTRSRFLKRFESFLRDLSKMSPLYAVTGNHEFYNGQEESIRWMRSLGVHVLDGERMHDRNTGLDIAGVSDPSSFLTPKEYRGSLLKSLEDHPPEIPFILVNHQPLLFRELSKRYRFLQLSGHTHAGQLWPFGLGTRLMFKEGDRGLHRSGESYLYVCTGTGTWGPPLRIGTESQMIIFEVE